MNARKGVITTLLIILGIIAVGALLFFFLRTPAPEPEKPVANITNITMPVKTGAEFGDMVTINYILKLENGTVVDTNDENLAKENNLKDYIAGPYTFILGQSGKIPGFDEALMGMNVGDHKETTIEPSEKEMILGVNKTKIIPRLITINSRQAFPKEKFESFFGKPPKVNDIVYSTKFVFKYKVTNITNDTVITDIYVKEKEEYTLPNTEWKSKVAKVSDGTILFQQNPKENQTLDTQFGPAKINFTSGRIYINYEPELGKVFNRSIPVGAGFSIPQQFQVEEIKDDYFVVKRYGVLAEKKLKIIADMMNITADVKEVKEKPKITEVTGKDSEN